MSDDEDDRVEVRQPHSVCRFVRQDGEHVKGCTCQVWPDEVDIDDGGVSHLAEKAEDCPHRSGGQLDEEGKLFLQDVVANPERHDGVEESPLEGAAPEEWAVFSAYVKVDPMAANALHISEALRAEGFDVRTVKRLDVLGIENFRDDDG